MAVLAAGELVAGGQGQLEEAVFAGRLRSDQVETGAGAFRLEGDHHVATQVTAGGLEAGLDAVAAAFRDREIGGMAGAEQLGDRHLGTRRKIERETALGPAVEARLAHGGQRVDVGGPFGVEIELLVISDLHLLLGARADREDAQFEGFIILLLEQAGVAVLLFVGVVDLPRLFFFDHFADHFLAIYPHAEAGDRSGFRHREGIKRFDHAIFGIAENLLDPGDRHAVVDPDLDLVGFDLEDAAEAAVGDQEAGRLCRPRQEGQGGERQKSEARKKPLAGGGSNTFGNHRLLQSLEAALRQLR